MQHHFDVELAQRYGAEEAILLNHFEYWIELNRANGENYYDGRYWTFNSMKAFATIFPYMSEKKIRNALKHLQDEGIIVTGNYNKQPWDRTLWYAFTDYGLSICPFGKMDDSEKANGHSQKGEPIPDNNPDNNPVNKENTLSIERVQKKDRGTVKLGEFENVSLSNSELKKLEDCMGDICMKEYIEKLSGFIAQTGRRYRSHYATILNWWRRDGKPVQRQVKPFEVDRSRFRRSITEDMTVDDIF